MLYLCSQTATLQQNYSQNLSKAKCVYLIKCGIKAHLKSILFISINNFPFYSLSFDERLNHANLSNDRKHSLILEKNQISLKGIGWTLFAWKTSQNTKKLVVETRAFSMLQIMFKLLFGIWIKLLMKCVGYCIYQKMDNNDNFTLLINNDNWTTDFTVFIFSFEHWNKVFY